MTSEEKLAGIETRLANVETILGRVRSVDLAEVKDSLLVQAHLVTNFERKVDGWIESAETRMAQLEVLSVAVLERIDRFIAGQEPNGHGK